MCKRIPYSCDLGPQQRVTANQQKVALSHRWSNRSILTGLLSSIPLFIDHNRVREWVDEDEKDVIHMLWLTRSHLNSNISILADLWINIFNACLHHCVTIQLMEEHHLEAPDTWWNGFKLFSLTVTLPQHFKHYTWVFSLLRHQSLISIALIWFIVCCFKFTGYTNCTKWALKINNSKTHKVCWKSTVLSCDCVNYFWSVTLLWWSKAYTEHYHV